MTPPNLEPGAFVAPNGAIVFERPYRTVVAATPETKGQYARVYCDDGAVFYWCHDEWIAVTPVPGTRAAAEVAR